jgi:hypothetical protein
MGGLKGYTLISEEPPTKKSEKKYESLEEILEELEYEKKDNEIKRKLREERAKSPNKDKA